MSRKNSVALTLLPVEQNLVRGYIYLDKNEKKQKNEETIKRKNYEESYRTIIK